jgi:hypothetical protein
MSRERLTSRTAEDMKSKAGTPTMDKGTGIDNDAYDMNDTGHDKNNPKMDAYATGDPEKWAEGVNKDNPARDDHKREDTGHAPLVDKHAAAEAVASAKRLEAKAIKCIIAAQRILPGAGDEIIEKQAAVLMHLPEEGLNATLGYQEELAKQIAKQASGAAEDDEEEEDKAKKEAAEKELTRKQKRLEELKKQASEIEKEIEAGQNAKANANWPTGKGKKSKDASSQEDDEEDKKDDKKDDKAACDKPKADEEDKKDDKSAAKADDKDEEEDKSAAKKKEDDEEEDKSAAVKKEDEEEDKSAAKKKEDDEEEDKKAGVELEASDGTLLDQIFGEVTASETKKGASKLSGMVKKEASTVNADNLSSIWASAPDVSNMF